MFNDIFSLANSFGTTFGLSGNPEFLNDDICCHDYILKLEVKDYLKDYISDDQAKEIFDLVTEAFMKGSKWDIEYQNLEFKFDREELTIIQINHSMDKYKG